jgi:HlyD family secretion protein
MQSEIDAEHLAAVWVGGHIRITARVSGAIIAPGQLVVETSIKSIQHLTGGVVGEIFVRDGDRVEAGDILLRLEAKAIEVNLSIVDNRLIAQRAKRARLQAELDRSQVIRFPDNILSRKEEPVVSDALESEKNVFELRNSLLEGQVAQRRERIAGLQEEKRGLVLQAKAKSRELTLIDVEVENVRNLWKQGLAASVNVTELERKQAQLSGESGRILAASAALRAQISETELGILELEYDWSSKTAAALQEADSEIEELFERQTVAEDQLERLNIRTSQTGIVTRSTVHSLAGVVAPGEVLMQIVPQNSELTVESRVDPSDIDQIVRGQRSKLRFSSFSQAKTPEIFGVVRRISANVEIDPVTNIPFYSVHLEIPQSELENLETVSLLPGMPLEVFFETKERSVVSYLVKPLSDQLERTFRE